MTKGTFSMDYWSNETAATPDEQLMCDAIKPQLEKESGQNFMLFVAKTYRCQVIPGTYYIVKVAVSPAGIGNCVFVHIFETLDLNKLPVLNSFCLHKNESDPLPVSCITETVTSISADDE